jgi:hypothetical protein
MDHFDDLVFIGVIFLIIGAIYIAPTFVAFRRNHPNRWIIMVINIAFGGTVIGWGIAMVWAMRAIHQVGSISSGGDSGLNLFINDVRKIQVVGPPAAAPNISCSRAGAPSWPLRPRRDFPG